MGHHLRAQCSAALTFNIQSMPKIKLNIFAPIIPRSLCFNTCIDQSMPFVYVFFFCYTIQQKIKLSPRNMLPSCECSQTIEILFAIQTYFVCLPFRATVQQPNTVQQKEEKKSSTKYSTNTNTVHITYVRVCAIQPLIFHHIYFNVLNLLVFFALFSHCNFQLGYICRCAWNSSEVDVRFCSFTLPYKFCCFFSFGQFAHHPPNLDVNLF